MLVRLSALTSLTSLTSKGILSQKKDVKKSYSVIF